MDDRPSVNLAAIKDNPWRIIMRVKRTLMEAGRWHQIRSFEEKAGKNAVMDRPTAQLTERHRQRALAAAKEFCRVEGVE